MPRARAGLPHTRPLGSPDTFIEHHLQPGPGLGTASCPGTRGPETPPQQGRQGGEAAMAVSVSVSSHSPATAATSSAWSGGLVTVTIPTHFRHRGEQGRARSGPLSKAQGPCSQGPALGEFLGGSGLGSTVPEGGQTSHSQVPQLALVFGWLLAPLFLRELAAAGILGWGRRLQEQLGLCRGAPVSGQSRGPPPHPRAQLTWGPHSLPSQLPDMQAKVGRAQGQDAGGHDEEEEGQRAVPLSGRQHQAAHRIMRPVPREHGAKPGLRAPGTRDAEPAVSPQPPAAPPSCCPSCLGPLPGSPPKAHRDSLCPRLTAALSAAGEGPCGTVDTLEAKCERPWRQTDRRTDRRTGCRAAGWVWTPPQPL